MVDETLRVKIEAAKSLHDYDHAFVSAEGVEHFGKIFEVNLKSSMMTANPKDIKGLTLNDGRAAAEGMCAAQMAEEICSQLDVEYVSKFGRGSQLHECARALAAHFEKLAS